MLVTLTLFELKKKFFNRHDCLMHLSFILINMVVVPFTINPELTLLRQLFLPIMITTAVLGMILVTSNSFDEDGQDGTLDQLITFGVARYMIYLSKVISSTLEFMAIITIALPFALAIYGLDYNNIIEIWFSLMVTLPILTAVSVFSSLLTLNTRKNNSLSIILVMPLVISILILLSFSLNIAVNYNHFSDAIPYIQIIIGISLISIVLLTLLSHQLS